MIPMSSAEILPSVLTVDRLHEESWARRTAHARLSCRRMRFHLSWPVTNQNRTCGLRVRVRCSAAYSASYRQLPTVNDEEVGLHTEGTEITEVKEEAIHRA